VRLRVTVHDGGRGRLFLPVPFDPDELWTRKPRHHVGGTVNDRKVRGVVERYAEQWGLVMGAMWARDCGIAVGDQVLLDIEPEGPQRTDLAEDIAAALAANPRAGEFFDGLAQFYRKGYLRWIDGTKRNPAERERRIAKAVELLAAGVKDYRQQ
jgi:Bacteriocin-protection, YdeI or OmpD-Associated